MKGILALLVWVIAAVRTQGVVQSFLQQFSVSGASENPFNRSERKRPQRGEAKGEEALEGELRFLLVSTFQPQAPGSGKVWVVPSSAEERKDSFVLVAGLQTPTGVCYDRNHEFLYVCDPGMRAVLQFEINSGKGRQFTLATDQVATIYQGLAPSACAVDGFGNLYIADSAGNSIEYVNYRDLWTGYVGMNTTLYRGYGETAGVGGPIGIQVIDSETLYFANSRNEDDFGLINSAPAQQFRDITSLSVLLRSEQRPLGLALSSKFAYYSSDDNTIWAFRYQGKPSLYLKSAEFFTSPRGLCYSNGNVYIADYSQGEVFYFPDNQSERVALKGFIRVAGAYGLACINS